MTYDDFTRSSVLQIIYENYYYEQLAKIVRNTPSLLMTDVFCRDTFCRFVSRT